MTQNMFLHVTAEGGSGREQFLRQELLSTERQLEAAEEKLRNAQSQFFEEQRRAEKVHIQFSEEQAY